MIVMNCTLASSGSSAMWTTASATRATSSIASAAIVPLACLTPLAMRAAISVTALPMSSWPQAMSYARPSSEIDLVRPVTACLVAVYGAESGRGGRDRPVVDDAAAARRLRLHRAERALGAQEHAGEVDVHHGAPGVERE